MMAMGFISLLTRLEQDVGLFLLQSNVRKTKKGAPLRTDFGLGGVGVRHHINWHW